jgi:hypothetical protein
LEFEAAPIGTSSSGPPPAELEAEITAVGDRLVASIREVIDALPVRTAGPQALARLLGIDKVLASRVLKAARARDPIAATHAMPGPEPLRRLIRAAGKRGADGARVAEAAAAIDQFESLIRERLGDRSLLDAVLSAWVPEARREFELRRKQAAFKAMSQIKGAQADAIVATVVVMPSARPRLLDVAWINGLAGLQRVRPGVQVKISTRRFTPGAGERRPTSLDGTSLEDESHLLIREFCSDPLPRLRIERAGQSVHYILGEPGFGPDSAVDVVFGESNRGELPRVLPADSSRRSFFFAEISVCAKVLQFDVLIHQDLYRSAPPELRIYDTSFEGVANLNDPARDVDQLDVLESVEPLGEGLARLRSIDVPRYAALMGHAFRALGVDPGVLRGFRCRVDYPIYGSQVALAFEPERESAVKLMAPDS